MGDRKFPALPPEFAVRAGRFPCPRRRETGRNTRQAAVINTETRRRTEKFPIAGNCFSQRAMTIAGGTPRPILAPARPAALAQPDNGPIDRFGVEAEAVADTGFALCCYPRRSIASATARHASAEGSLSS